MTRQQIQLVSGTPVPQDGSHAALDRQTGQQRDYVVLTPEERAKGFVKPVRRSYRHRNCGSVTTMAMAIAETYARDPGFYTGTFCARCVEHLPLDQFTWEPDGEPMHVPDQAAWHEERQTKPSGEQATAQPGERGDTTTKPERPVFSRAEKAAAWKWLRRVAEELEEASGHAAVALCEWQALHNALQEIADDPGTDARRLKFIAVDALTHTERMTPPERTGERGRNEAGSDAGAASIPESGG